MIDYAVLDNILIVLRKHKVSRFSTPELSMDLEALPSPEALKAREELDPEDVLFHSSPLGPPPKPGFQPIPADEQPQPPK